MTRRTDGRHLAFALLIVGLILLRSVSPLPAQTTGGQTVQLRADSDRPLENVLTELEDTYGWVITYEDPVYEHFAEVFDASHLVNRPSKRPLLLARGGFFYYDLIFEDGERVDRSDSFKIVREVVAAYNASGNPGRFRVVQTPDMLHVIPAASKNADGELVKRESVLGTRITIGFERRNAAQFLRDVVTAIQSVTGIEIKIMNAPINVFGRVDVEPEPASGLAFDILASGLHKMNAALSWRLLYSPERGDYMLTVRSVR